MQSQRYRIHHGEHGKPNGLYDHQLSLKFLKTTLLNKYLLKRMILVQAAYTSIEAQGEVFQFLLDPNSSANS